MVNITVKPQFNLLKIDARGPLADRESRDIARKAMRRAITELLDKRADRADASRLLKTDSMGQDTITTLRRCPTHAGQT